MKEAMLSAAAVCMLAALCEHVMDGGRYVRAVQLVLGLEIVRCFAALVAGMVQ